MHPIICQMGPVTIYSYGLMLVIAFVVSSRLACSYAKRQDINPDMIFNFLFFILILGILGARIFYIIENISYYLKNPWEVIMLQHGGLSWFGGLLAGVIFSLLYLKKNKLSPYRIFDLIIPFIALGQAIGRIGCLFNGCCFGRISEKFGLYFESQELMLIPTQIYSALLLTLIFIVLRFLQDRTYPETDRREGGSFTRAEARSEDDGVVTALRRGRATQPQAEEMTALPTSGFGTSSMPHKDGQIFFVYLLLYSIKRFFIEFLRADNAIIFSGLTLFQFLSIIIFCFASVWLFLKVRKHRKIPL
ncbi:MAG: prolipoprotein diacylglyceryl transferase [Candidatus Omnitrophota bacterium]